MKCPRGQSGVGSRLAPGGWNLDTGCRILDLSICNHILQDTSPSPLGEGVGGEAFKNLRRFAALN